MIEREVQRGRAAPADQQHGGEDQGLEAAEGWGAHEAQVNIPTE
jgi:hypothetical protein